MKILVTGFDPFGGESVNPAYEAVRLLPGRVGGADLVKLQVPTVFGKASELVTSAMDEIRPGAVVCIGQAGGRNAITPEKIAVNIMDARIPDNAGNQPRDLYIDPEGPAALFSTLPLSAIRDSLSGADVPCSLSYSAGTFVCNQLMYAVLLHAAKNAAPLPAGFIHVPFIEEQVSGKKEGTPFLPLPEIVRGLTLALEVVARQIVCS